MRSQIAVVLTAVAVGLAFGLALDIGDAAEWVVLPALIGLLTLTFASIRPAAWTPAVRPHRRIVVTSLVLNFAWTPVLALVLGATVLTGEPDLRIGLVMLLVTPCTDWYLVFTRSGGGNVALAAALLPLNLVLQLALLPVYVPLLTGADADVPLGELARGVVLVVGIPLAITLVVRAAAVRSGCSATFERAVGRLEPAGVLLLGVAIVGIFATHADTVVDDAAVVARVAAAVAAFLAIAYAVASLASRRLRAAHAERVALTMSTMARNSPVALAVAATTFPDRPLVAVVLVAGPLVELPALALVASRLRPPPTPAQRF